jgi:sortase (surface protein transpeptidase)
MFMNKPIYSTGDKVYLTEEEDFNDYEIVEINAVDDANTQQPLGDFKYKIRPVKGSQTILKSELEIFPITG